MVMLTGLAPAACTFADRASATAAPTTAARRVFMPHHASASSSSSLWALPVLTCRSGSEDADADEDDATARAARRLPDVRRPGRMGLLMIEVLEVAIIIAMVKYGSVRCVCVVCPHLHHREPHH